jgi:hypothetical protein
MAVEVCLRSVFVSLKKMERTCREKENLSCDSLLQ